MDGHEVISDFLDDEPFELAALARALDDPAGRALLLDAVALRRAVRDDPGVMPVAVRRAAAGRGRWIATGFLAASILFGAGAAWLLPPILHRQPADAPPAPDHVVVFETGAGAP
jgi:hypothetical protein